MKDTGLPHNMTQPWIQIDAELPLPRAVLFDWDNTLVDTWPVIHAALEETFIHGGLTPWTLDEVKARVQKSMRDSFPIIFGDDWPKYGEFYQLAYRKRQKDGIRPLAGAEAMLQSLQGKDLFLGVVSNKKGPGLRIESENLGWNGYFQALVGADDATHDKPHAAPVELALKDSGLKLGADVWFVGDSEIDLRTAANTGMTPIFFGEMGTAEVLAAKRYGEEHFAAYAQDHAALQALFAAHL
jgi:phosphoglycolate phosphatase